VRVLDKSLPLEDLDLAVRHEIWGLPSGEKAQNRFLAELWRWWDSVSIDLLRGRRTGVAVSQLKTFVQELRDGYGPDSLRTTVLRSDVSDEDVDEHSTGRFYDQMVAVRYNRPNLRLAVVDYYRALKQETEWLDDSLIGLRELETFEANLRDEWARAFNDMLDDLSGGSGEYDPATVDEEMKWRAGKELLRTLLESTRVTVRKYYDDSFFARGKRHELAHRDNELGIGWHPDFADRLEGLVASVVGGSTGASSGRSA
jgi:cation diffusion facilitator CzcD-associated flavoprotein CzcO